MKLDPRRPFTAFLTVLTLAAALLVSGGCGSDNAAGPNKRVPLTLRAQGIGGASQRFVSAASLAAAMAADTDSIPVTFTRALLVVRDVRFVMAGDDVEDDDDDSLEVGDDDSTDVGDDDSTEVEHEGEGGQVRFHGPFVIDLLAGDAQNLGTQMVPAGVYHHVMGHLQKLAGGGDLATQYPDLVGSTVLLEGDIAGDGGGHFVYMARIDTEFMIRGSFEVTGEAPVTSFVVFDLSAFLRGRDGAFLDPRNVDNDHAIQQAIKHAVKSCIDHDHDGEPDDGLADSD
jgi:hypothetical protein